MNFHGKLDTGDRLFALSQLPEAQQLVADAFVAAIQKTRGLQDGDVVEATYHMPTGQMTFTHKRLVKESIINFEMLNPKPGKVAVKFLFEDGDYKACSFDGDGINNCYVQVWESK